MKPFFHHPDFSLPVLRRRTAEAFLDMLIVYSDILGSGGRSLTWSSCFPSRTARDTAVSRLRRAGVIAYRRARDGKRVLAVTKEAVLKDRALFRPERMWKQKWRGIWSVLTYDIPESERGFRDGMRRLLVRLRMGCLQKSVWVSPRDVRADYDNLVQSVGVEFVSFLFEARTVLGRHAQDIVQFAWDFERLDALHMWYLKEAERNLARLRGHDLDHRALERLATEELTAYLQALQEDPLLPEALLPADYLGFKVAKLHRTFVAETGERLRRLR